MKWYLNWVSNREKVVKKYGEKLVFFFAVVYFELTVFRWYRIWVLFLGYSTIISRRTCTLLLFSDSYVASSQRRRCSLRLFLRWCARFLSYDVSEGQCDGNRLEGVGERRRVQCTSHIGRSRRLILGECQRRHEWQWKCEQVAKSHLGRS